MKDSVNVLKRKQLCLLAPNPYNERIDGFSMYIAVLSQVLQGFHLEEHPLQYPTKGLSMTECFSLTVGFIHSLSNLTLIAQLLFKVHEKNISSLLI